MKAITSVTNSLIIEANKLKDRKFRYLNKRYLIEGRKLVDEAIKFNQRVFCVFATSELIEYYVGLLGTTQCEIIEVSDNVLDKLSDTRTPQGVVAVVSMREPNVILNGKALLLDGLQDAGNVGTILRTAMATGYNNVYLINNCVDVYSSKCLRAAMSAQFQLNIIEVSIEQLNEFALCKQFICADMNGINIFSDKLQIKDDHILVMGSEGQGVSKQVEQLCTLTISLPMVNNLESLNVSISASVIMYNFSFGKRGG